MGLELGEFDQRRGGHRCLKAPKTAPKTGPLDRLHRAAKVCMVVCAISTTTNA